MAQLMPLPLTVSCFSKIQIGFTFLVPAHLDSPGKRAVKRVCVCVVFFPIILPVRVSALLAMYVLIRLIDSVSSLVCPMMECCCVDDTSPERAVTGLSPG